MQRAIHLNPICKQDGCDRATVARGMCYKHYQIWKRCNPGVAVAPDRKDTERMILDALPATRAQVEEKTGLHEVTILRYLPKLRAAKRVYIVDYDPPTLDSKHWIPIYARRERGVKTDAVLTEERKRSLARVRQEQRAQRQLERQAALLYADVFNLTGRRPDVSTQLQD